MNPSYTYPRETVEYVYFKEFLLNGETPVAAEYALTRGFVRPKTEDWAPLVVVNARFAFLLPGTLEPGQYKVWARVTDNPERTVIEVAEIEVT